MSYFSRGKKISSSEIQMFWAVIEVFKMFTLAVVNSYFTCWVVMLKWKEKWFDVVVQTEDFCGFKCNRCGYFFIFYLLYFKCMQKSFLEWVKVINRQEEEESLLLLFCFKQRIEFRELIVDRQTIKSIDIERLFLICQE